MIILEQKLKLKKKHKMLLRMKINNKIKTKKILQKNKRLLKK